MTPGGTFPGWTYGDFAPGTHSLVRRRRCVLIVHSWCAGNLLGTIRGLDGQDNTPLNCTVNANILDNVRMTLT